MSLVYVCVRACVYIYIYIYTNSKITYPLVFFFSLQKTKNVKRVILSHVQKGKKKPSRKNNSF